MQTPKRKRFKVIDNTDPAAPYALIDCSTDEIVRSHTRPRVLVDLAFDTFGADEVRHGYDLIRAENRT